ncbi:MAG: hypothetical protein IPI81_00100 [Flavobacteriales bacterium]|nr:hypothetical protein [Flavobacteriales bacterium]MCC6937108.1 hypothetical protein [Flavobacteriales bacterium]
MNTNWAKILLFSFLSFILGYILCCLTCGPWSRHGGDCERGGMGHCSMGMGHQGMAACEHGGERCTMGGKCAMEGCDHKMGAACCKGGGMHGDANVHGLVKGLEAAGFQGDTTITIEGGTVVVHRMGDSTRVEMEMRDGMHHGDMHHGMMKEVEVKKEITR